MAISIKQILISGEQIETIEKIQEERHKKSGVGIAPTLHEIARGLIDKTLVGYM